MTKIVAEILRDAALRPTSIKMKRLKIDYEFYRSGAVSKIILSGRRASIPRLFEVLNMIYPRDVNVSVRGSHWFDRNAVSKCGQYLGTLAPHAATDRLTYTCPSGKIAMVEMVRVGIRRFTAAGTSGGFSGWASFQPLGKGTTYTIFGVYLLSNTVGTDKEVHLGVTLTMFPDDKMIFRTIDESVTGTCVFDMSYKLTEFDA